MKNICNITRVVSIAATLAAIALTTEKSTATPYASSVTNNAGTIQFYLNESNATVVVTFEDGSTNANFNGVTTGTNLLKGLQSFSLAGHSSYNIAVTKNGSGSASLLATHAVPASRGVDVNKIGNSPQFGQVYIAVSTVAATNAALRRLYPDMTLLNTNSGGVGWLNSASEPYRLAVNDDGYITVGSFASAHSGVWRIDPTLVSNQLVLGPIGDTAGAANNSHGSIFSRPLLIGNIQSGGSAVLYQIDAGNFAFNSAQLNSILVYSNISLATMPRTTAPDLLGPATGLNQVLNNNYPGITVGPNGYFYVSNRRDVSGKANVQVYDANLNPLWDSVNSTGISDPFIVSGLGLTDGAVSPDGKFFAGVGITDNHITVCSLTNGIPDISTIYTIINSNTTTQARGLCWDAADNIYISSSGVGGVQQWSLGLSAKAVTKGDASGQTNFALILPSTQVSVTATTPFASQSGPTAGEFTITRNSAISSDTNSPLTVFYTLGGTATNGTYTITGGTSTSVTLAPGQNSTNIIITPVNDSQSRPTTTVILTIAGNGNYASLAPVSATISIQNIGPQVVFISSAPGSSMYKGLTNDYGSFVLTRWGDTNAAAYVVSNFTYTGTAGTNVQVTPAQPITINPGDINVTNISMNPLIDTTSYVGNKTVTVGLGAGVGYTAGTNKVTLTIIDNANLPATVLWTNSLTDPNDVTNWAVTIANNDMQNVGVDSTVEFGYDLTANNPETANYGLLPLPPSGATNCLRVTVNKNNGRASGVNLYPTNVVFSGDYAVRFAMNITEGSVPANTTEGPLFGINHTGLYTNWWSGSAILSGWDPSNTSSNWTSDGIWYWIAADGGASAGDYIEKSGVGGTNGNTGWVNLATASRTSTANLFKHPTPYSSMNSETAAATGLPANSSPANGLSGGYTNAWADVEIKTVNRKVTMSINKSVIFTYNNTNSVWTSGTIMLGYNDPFSSIGGSDGAVYFSDIKVVRLAPPLISTQPTNLVLATGATATYAVVVSYDSSAANTNGQWLLNGVAISGATNNSYSFTVNSASYGTYAWTNFDGNYGIVSSNATLRPPAFTITTNPLPSIVVASGVATNLISAANSFSGVTNYQWQLTSTNLPGAANRTYSFTAGPLTYGTYRVIVNDNWNFATSTVAIVTPPAPSIVTPPAGRAAVVGSSPSLTVVPSTFSGVTNYQWFLAGSPVSASVGGTSRTLTLTNIQLSSFGSYTVRVNDGFISVTSAPPAVITVAVSPLISSPSRTGNSFVLTLNTEVGPAYVAEYKTNLLQAAWTPVQTNSGTGGSINVTNVNNADAVFYRIRLQ